MASNKRKQKRKHQFVKRERIRRPGEWLVTFVVFDCESFSVLIMWHVESLLFFCAFRQQHLKHFVLFQLWLFLGVTKPAGKLNLFLLYNFFWLISGSTLAWHFTLRFTAFRRESRLVRCERERQKKKSHFIHSRSTQNAKMSRETLVFCDALARFMRVRSTRDVVDVTASLQFHSRHETINRWPNISIGFTYFGIN